MENKNCPNCGNILFHNKGVSKKTGKPYENYKCGQCEYIKWVDTPKEAPQEEKSEEQPQTPKKDAALMILDTLTAIHKVLEEIRDKDKYEPPTDS